MPLEYHPLFFFPAEDTDGRRVHCKDSTRQRRKPEPDGRKDADDVSVREHQNIGLIRVNTRQESRGPLYSSQSVRTLVKGS